MGGNLWPRGHWMKIALLATLLACNAGWGANGSRDAPPATAGSLAIETRLRRISAGGFPNTSGNPFARVPVTLFRVLFEGRPVVVDLGGLDVEEFPAAWILDGAPRPAVLAVAAGAYLVSERDGRVETTVLVAPDGDLPRLQWLDARDGRPAEPIEVAIRDARGEPLRLAGGRWLLLARRVLLDVATLESRPVDWWRSASEPAEYNPSNSPVKALSPGGTQIVLVGNRDRDGRYEYALVVVDLPTNRAYAVPFDAAATRFDSIADVTPAWIAHSFEWRRAADGGERLAPRQGAAPPPRRGRLVRLGGSMVEYRLARARPGLLAALRDFIVADLCGRAGAVEEGGNRVALEVEGWPLWLWYRAEEAELSLFTESNPRGSTDPAYALVERIGERFDAELARGRHQEQFGPAER